MKRKVLFVILMAWMILVFTFSHQNGGQSSETSSQFIKILIEFLPFTQGMNGEQLENFMSGIHAFIRKLAHFSIYAVGGIVAYFFVSTYNVSKKKTLLIAIAICFAYAMFDEIHQRFVPGRSGEIRDVLIDTSGAVLGGLTGLCLSIVIYKFSYLRNIKRSKKCKLINENCSKKGNENMDKKRIFLASPHMSDEGYEQAYVKEAFDTNWIAPLGENVNKFEEEIATYVGINNKNAAALSAGTAAIHMALKALGVGEGDIVFCSSLTFSASANPIIYQNATPVFIDSEADTWNMDPKALEKAFEVYPNPKAVVLVHLYGTPAKMDEIMEICKRHNVPLVEDAAESLGATYKEKQTGTFGKYGVYSFNGNKIITTSGGGMLVAQDTEMVNKVRFWVTQSREKARHYEHKEIGYNYRMSNVLAGIGRGQLKVLKERIAKKEEIYNTYKEAFKDIEDIEMQPYLSDSKPNFWLSVITLKEDSKVTPLQIMEALEKENVESRPVWKPMHLQPVFEKYDFFTKDGKWNSKEFTVSEDLFNRGVCLPSDTKNTKEDMDRIIEIIKGLF